MYALSLNSDKQNISERWFRK